MSDTVIITKLEKLKIIGNKGKKLYRNLLQLIKEKTKKTMPFVLKHKRWLIGGVVGMVVIFASIIILSTTQHRTTVVSTAGISQPVAPKSYVSQQLTDIADKLAHVEQQMSGSSAVVNFDAIQKSLAHLTIQTQQLATQSNALIAKQIQTSTHGLQAQLIIMNQRLQKLVNEQKHVKYISASNLPFNVGHIDNIQQQDVVTIHYNHTTFPIDIGDYIAGWKLISADFVSQKAEFVNSKKQHVVVDLNRIQPQGGHQIW